MNPCTRRAGLAVLLLAAACSSAPPPSAPGTVVPSAPSPSVAPVSTTVPVSINCVTALATDTTGSNLPPAYAQLEQRIEDAACHHDYQTLASLMAGSFIYDADGSRGSPGQVVGIWQSKYSTGSNLRLLAKALTAPATFKQGTYTIRSAGATVIFQRGQWTGFY